MPWGTAFQRSVRAPSHRLRHQVVPLHADDVRTREFAHLQLFADLLRRQQMHHAVDFRRIGVAAADAALAPQARRVVDRAGR